MTTSAPLCPSTLVALNDQRSGEKEPSMLIIGCDFHPKFQQIAFTDTETGECEERRLHHPQEAEQFYRALAGGKARVGMEATGSFRWFRRLLSGLGHELGHELWLGNPTEIRASAPRRQKTDKRDARQLLQLLLEERFPQVWLPTVADEDLRQLLLHRCRFGSPAHQGEESARRDRQERRSGWPANRDTERAPATGSLAAVRLVPATAPGSVRVVGPAGGAHRPLEPSGAASGRRTSRRPTLDDASGSRSGGGISLRVGD